MASSGLLPALRTGSRMTANLSSFLRFKYNNKGQANEEQDLQGFDSAASAKTALSNKQMGTIQEGPDESPDSAKAAHANPTRAPFSNGHMSRCGCRARLWLC